MYAYKHCICCVILCQAVNTHMVVVNLQQIGPVPHRFVSRAELDIVLTSAEEIIRDTPESELDEILNEWETGLTWRALEVAPVDESWYTRALLLTCLRGLRGEIAPQFYWLNNLD
jgi:hypothetical protein